MNYLIPGLGESGKMSSSEPNSKIDFDDSDDLIKKKINKLVKRNGEVQRIRFFLPMPSGIDAIENL